MAGQLFRQEALAHQGERFWGDCTGLNPVTFSLLAWLLVLLAATCAWLLVTGEYHRKAVVTGVLVADKGVIEVRAPADGMLEEVKAGFGERVGKGELLLTLGPGMVESGGEAVAGKLLKVTRQQEALLHGLIRNRQAEFPLRQQQLDADLTGMRERRQRLESLVRNEQAVRELLRGHYGRMQNLQTRGLAARGDVEAARIDLLKQEAVLMQAQMELAETGRMLDKSGMDAALLPFDHAVQLGELKRGLSELRKQEVQLQAERQMEVVAPVAGTVAVLMKQRGQTVVARQPLLSIVPDDSVIEAELKVPSRAIGFLEAGQQVNLRFDAFPYQKFGIGFARISEVSRVPVLTPGTSEPGSRQASYFKVAAVLEDQSISAFGEEFRLRPGMQFQADIVLESRSLLEWLLEPLLIAGRLRGNGR